AVDVLQRQSAIGERTLCALRHEIHRAHAVGDLTEIALGHTHDRSSAALQAVHHVASGVNTGIGSFSPPGLCTRNLTRMPIFTASGATSSTRLISRKPSSQSISATLYGCPSAGCTTVV